MNAQVEVRCKTMCVELQEIFLNDHKDLHCVNRLHGWSTYGVPESGGFLTIPITKM